MREKGTKNERIIKAALDQFSKKGYDKATIDDIAKKSKVSKGIVFFYFKKKASLVEKVALLSVPLDEIKEVNQKKYQSGEELLIDFGRSFLKKYEDKKMRNLLLMTIAGKNRFPVIEDALETLCFQQMDAMFSKVESLAGGKIPAPLRRALFGSLLCYVVWWDKNMLKPSEYVEMLVSQILKNVVKQ